MQATITYTLSQEAQRAQMAATGQPVAREQTHVIEVEPGDLDMLSVDDEGNLKENIGRTSIHFRQEGVPAVWSARTPQEAWEAYKAAYRAREVEYEAERVAKQQEEERRLRETEAGDARAAAWVDAITTREPYGLMEDAFRAAGVKSPNWLAKRPLFEAAIERLKGRNEAEAERKKAAEAEKEAAKKEYLDRFFLSGLTNRLRPEPAEMVNHQYFMGLLCRSRALEIVAERVLDPIGASYEPRVCDRSDCRCGQRTVPCVPPEVYPALAALREKLPEGSTLELRRVRECLRDDDGFFDGDGEESASDPVFAVNVKLPEGPFTFERLVKLDEC